MATLEQLSAALVNADAAGDTAAASALASEIKRMREPQGIVANTMDFVKSIPGGMMRGFASAPNPNMALSQDELMTEEAGRRQAGETVANMMPQAQGRGGRIGNAIGEGLGNPLSWIGPGGALLKAGGAALSSAGGEGGRQAAEGTVFEKPAQIAGALAGGAAAVKTLGAKASKAAVPTYRELKDAATRDYNAAQASGLELHPQGTASFAARLQQELESNPKLAFTDRDAPKTFAELQSLQNPPAGTVAITASNLDTLRTKLGRYARETSEGKPTPEAAAASAALSYYNKYLENLPPGHVLAGSAKDYVSATKQGNANYSAAQRVRLVDKKINAAELNTEGSIAASLDNQIKSQLRPILKNESLQRGWLPEELEAARGVNKGTRTSNFLRQIGRGGAGVIPLMAQAAAAPGVFAVGGLPGLALQGGVAGTLYGARKGAEALTKRQANKLAELLAQRSPEYQSRVANLPPADMTPNKAAIIRALLAQ